MGQPIGAQSVIRKLGGHAMAIADMHIALIHLMPQGRLRYINCTSWCFVIGKVNAGAEQMEV